MILAEDEVAIGTDHDGIMVLPRALDAGLAARRRAADRHRRARARDHAEPARLPARLRRRARGPRRHRRAARARRRGPRIPARPATSRARASTVEDPDLCPRFTARLFEDVTDRPVARVAEGAPDGRGPAPDQQRRRHHQLRDAADRPADARVRLRPRRRRRLIVRRAREGETMTTLDDVERTLDPSMLLIADDDGPTSIAGADGRRALRGARDDHARADGGGELERPEPPAHLDQARRCAPRRPGASRRGSRPSRRWTARSSPRS